MIEGLLGGLFNGLSIGSVLLIVALGLAIVFGLMGVINLAHGELMMLGAYTTYVVQNGAAAIGSGALEIYFLVALPIAFLVAAAVGLLLERGVIRHLYGRPLETLLATWGVSLILRQFIRSVSWSLVIGLVIFCVLFFGGRWILQRQANWERLSRIANPVVLMLSGAIAIITGILINQSGNTTLSRAWFGARNVDVTAPSWLRGGVSVSGEVASQLYWAITVGVFLFALLWIVGYFAFIRSERQITERLDNDRVVLIASALLASILTLFTFFLNQPARPDWFSSGVPLQFPYARLFIIGLTIVCLIGIYWFLNGTAWGLRIRSVTQNRKMSACLGIPTEKVDALSFALGSGLAGIAGCAVTLLGSVGPNLGGNYIVDAFMVVVVGGVGKLAGSIVAALVIGIVTYLIGSGTIALLFTPFPALQPVTDFFTFFATTSMAKVMVFALIIAFLQWKPAGMFPQKGRSVEV
ncbi:branched-chain amino acid ABC transporter permease [Halomicronema sp. CCY15110]|uniref:ABC transporter permease subunit n=1 Tax=Halomicronema sp. CCY15110 TaxID=2767773 RepID=UPI001950AB36|nr:branched-chain amino acid ABC transporter permease [Halomicronema sp. CCY15110]